MYYAMLQSCGPASKAKKKVDAPVMQARTGMIVETLGRKSLNYALENIGEPAKQTSLIKTCLQKVLIALKKYIISQSVIEQV